MRDFMKYINSVNEVINFGGENILINENDFRDYSWRYDTIYNRVLNFNKGVFVKKLPVIVYGGNCREVANNLFNIIEKDVLTNTPGAMWIGEYYLEGYFFSSTKEGYTKTNSIEIQLEFATENPNWLKKTSYIYRKNDELVNDRGLGYDYDYPYDFMSGINMQNLFNSGIVPADVEITIYGAVNNPAVTIAGNTYKVNAEIYSNEYLRINTMNKEVYKIDSRGRKINEFMNRDTNSGYIFQKIPTGINSVTVSPSSDFDITVIESRGEPLWI